MFLLAKMTLRLKLIIGLGTFIAVAMLWGTIIINNIYNLGISSQKLYTHGFIIHDMLTYINRALKELGQINKNLITTAQKEEDIKALTHQSTLLQVKIRDHFDKIIERTFDKQKVKQARLDFLEWQQFYEQFKALIETQQQDKASQLNQDEITKQLTTLLETNQQIIDLTKNKTKVFFRHIDSLETRANWSTYGFIACMILFSLLMFYFLTQQVIDPLTRAVSVLHRLADGDLEVDTHFKPALKETNQLSMATQSISQSLTRIITEVREHADVLVQTSDQVRTTAQLLSQAATEQAASMEQTSASLQQINASIVQTTENARLTDNMANQSVNEAEEGVKAAAATVTAMQEIEQKINFIQDIAYKTNMLALNAAIEAARAGEHGKGFKVVAAEVRKLAENSHMVAQEIDILANDSMLIAKRTGKPLETIVPNIKKTADLIERITAVSREQAIRVSQIMQVVGQLDKISQQNASAAEQLVSSSQEINHQAEHLRKTIGFFKLSPLAPQQPSVVQPTPVTPTSRATAPMKKYLPLTNVKTREINTTTELLEKDFERF
jgi:methyl-accepting chemotaxis protein